MIITVLQYIYIYVYITIVVVCMMNAGKVMMINKIQM